MLSETWGKSFNTTLICIHSPTEEEEAEKNFYDKLDRVYQKAPTHDIKIIMGDMNAKVGKDMRAHNAGKHSLHEVSNDNGMRLIDFAVSKNMVNSSVRFPHKDIHEETWISPDGHTKNQIDHVLIDARRASYIIDVRSYRAADCDSDHYLVKIKY
jgi:endonuclease/exonuclease/phosphatase family metal-dependent hydrolase